MKMIFHFTDGSTKTIDLGRGASFDVGEPRRSERGIFTFPAVNPDTFARFKEQGGEEILRDPKLIGPAEIILDEDDGVVERVHKTYDEIATEYSAKIDDLVFNSWIRKFVEGLLDKFISTIQSPEPKILEIGCGNGRTVQYLMQKGVDIIGTDISAGMLNEAKKSVPNGNFYQMDMRDLGFLDDSFDGVWADGCIYHVTKRDIARVLRGIFRILKSSGVFSFNFKTGVGEQMEQNPRSYGGRPRFYAYYTIEEMKNLVRRAGFEVVEVQVYPEKILDEEIVHIWAKKP